MFAKVRYRQARGSTAYVGRGFTPIRWLRLKAGIGLPAGSKKFLASTAGLRRNSSAELCQRLLPERVTALITPPEADYSGILFCQAKPILPNQDDHGPTFLLTRISHHNLVRFRTSPEGMKIIAGGKRSAAPGIKPFSLPTLEPGAALRLPPANVLPPFQGGYKAHANWPRPLFVVRNPG